MNINLSNLSHYAPSFLFVNVLSQCSAVHCCKSAQKKKPRRTQVAELAANVSRSSIKINYSNISDAAMPPKWKCICVLCVGGRCAPAWHLTISDVLQSTLTASARQLPHRSSKEAQTETLTPDGDSGEHSYRIRVNIQSLSIGHFDRDREHRLEGDRILHCGVFGVFSCTVCRSLRSVPTKSCKTGAHRYSILMSSVHLLHNLSFWSSGWPRPALVAAQHPSRFIIYL